MKKVGSYKVHKELSPKQQLKKNSIKSLYFFVMGRDAMGTFIKFIKNFFVKRGYRSSVAIFLKKKMSKGFKSRQSRPITCMHMHTTLFFQGLNFY